MGFNSGFKGLKKREFSAEPKNVTKENQNTEENLMTDLTLREPKYCKIFSALVGRRLMGYSRLLPLQRLKGNTGSCICLTLDLDMSHVSPQCVSVVSYFVYVCHVEVEGKTYT